MVFANGYKNKMLSSIEFFNNFFSCIDDVHGKIVAHFLLLIFSSDASKHDISN